jgi:hypothetical protein
VPVAVRSNQTAINIITMSISPFFENCNASPCLSQVAGLVNGDASIQYEACTSLFGVPTVTT